MTTREVIASDPMKKKSYEQHFDNANKQGLRMFKREHLYASGPPNTEVSGESIAFVKQKAGKKILDIGCGIGACCKQLIEFGFECTGVEGNEEYVRQARAQGIEAYVMHAESLDIPSKTFDTALLFEVLEHIDNVDSVLEEAKRVTKKNILITVPNIGCLSELVPYNVIPHHFFEPTHVNFFTKEMLERLLVDHFKTFTVEEYGNFFFLDKPLHYHLRAEAFVD